MRKLAWIALLVVGCTGHLVDEGGEAEAHEIQEEAREEAAEVGEEVVEPDSGPDPSAEPGAVAVVVDGLELSLAYTGKRRVEPGVYLSPKWTLRNTADGNRDYVQAGDGSEVGWREPHVYYTAKHSVDGQTWTDVETGDLGRCGLFDNDWHDEIAVLAPGQSIELAWTPEPAWQLRLQQAGHVRVWAHYEFSAGAGFGSSRGTSESLAQMEGVPAFHLVSAPLELEIVRPLDIVLHPKSPGKRVTKLSQAFDLTLENHGAARRSGAAPNANNMRVVARSGDEQGTLFDSDWEKHQRETQLALGSGASVQLLGDALDFEFPPELWSDDLEVNVRFDLGPDDGHLETGWVRVNGD